MGRMKLGAKISAGFLVIILLTIALIVTNYFSLNRTIECTELAFG
jgi:CHASE3 domain sensor protein